MKQAVHDLASTKLSESEIAAFQERGYHLHEQLFSDEKEPLL